MTSSEQQRSVERTLAMFETLLRAGNYAAVDDLLEGSPADCDTPAEILAILSITFHGKALLAERAAFVERARTFLTSALGDDRARALMEHRS